MADTDSSNLSFKDSLDKFLTFLKQNRRAHATILAYGKDVEQMEEYLAERRNKSNAGEVTTEDIEQFKIHLKNQNYTAKSISRKVNSIKSLFRFLKKQGLVSDNPATLVSHPKYEITPPRALSKMEYRALRDACRDDLRLSAIIELLLQTGTRIGELANLTIEDVDTAHKTITVKAYESHPERIIPMNQAAVKALSAYLKVRPKVRETTLFVTKTGKPFLVRNIRTAIDRYYKLAGIANAKVNDLRHTFIIQQLSAGVPLTYLSKIVGHKRISTTEKYLKLVETKLEKETVKIEEL
ncbi:hypothetical protein A3A66_03460 [Microgenomates group bacterium RIFCSPLOWO2_01_FULL_46_13]|nr:MAG: hypothetical protein A2783_04640 [Microgenomates group bacterium RIFCSPHIGHO2_01_FULL_45_11]OGV95046.1 MAG: hypothetical protein A3A66_03460 [Microgenomates group bacterium RIFCSPLOWO2_01_FULL_46_13]